MERKALKCKYCGKTLLHYTGDEKKFGKITKQCSSCGNYYLDPRFHEIALEGRPKTTTPLGDLVLVIIGTLILFRVHHLSTVKFVGTPYPMQVIMLVILLGLGLLTLFGGIYDFIQNITGAKEVKYEKLLKESKERLTDTEYLNLLENLGYKYIKK